MQEKKEVSFYEDVKKSKSEAISLEEVLNQIKAGRYQEWLDAIQEYKDGGDAEGAKLIKENLPCFTISGTYSDRRKAEYISHYNQLVILDYDDVEDVEKLKAAVVDDEKTMVAFISPSGSGLKVIVKVDSDLENHRLAFNQVKEYYEKEFGYKVDRSGSDVTRLCFMSSDPKIFINWNSKAFAIDLFADEEMSKARSEVGHKSTVVGDDSQEYQTAIEILDYLDEKEESITDEYSDWFKVGQALANTFDPEVGGRLYQRFAEQAGKKYDKNETDNQWQKAIKDDRNEIGFGTIVHKAKELGFQPSIKHKFWYADDNGNVQIDQLAFGEYLASHGFGKTMYEGECRFVRVESNVVRFVSSTDIKEFLKGSFDTLEEFSGMKGRDILRKIVNGSSTYMSRSTLEWMPTLDIDRNWDTKDESFIYYKNGALKITSNKTSLIEYEDLDTLVWEHELLDRKWEYRDFIKQSDFWRFLEYIAKDMDRLNALHTSIGYLLHRYKDPALSVAIDLMDEQMNEHDEANGGTGKTIVGNAIGKIRRVTSMDGKNTRFREFIFQSVSQNTNVIVFDDVTLKFNFDRLYSAITGDLTVEKKGKTPFIIPFAYAPKMLLSSNYDVSGGGGVSEMRRLKKVEFSKLLQFGKKTNKCVW